MYINGEPSHSRGQSRGRGQCRVQSRGRGQSRGHQFEHSSHRATSYTIETSQQLCRYLHLKIDNQASHLQNEP